MSEAVALAIANNIANNLVAFKSPQAQRILSEAMDKWRFGNSTPYSVVRALVTNLNKFTDPQAQIKVQRHIGFAINGRFRGPTIPKDLALLIAENLDKFTDTVTQRHIATDIDAGRFGTPIPPKVARALAANLGKGLCGQSVLPQTCTHRHEKDWTTQRRHVAKNYEIQEGPVQFHYDLSDIPISK